MTREEQIGNAVNSAYGYASCEDAGDRALFEIGFERGAEWADSHPIISKDMLEQLVEGIESGKVLTISQYSNSPEMSKAFDDGQIEVLKLLLTWINYKQKEAEQ